MADTYTLHIAGLTRELPICKVNDHLDIAAFIMFSDVELTEACAAALLKKAPEFDVILTAEAKGIPVSICGLAAGDPANAVQYLHMGLRSFSMGPQNLLSVKKALVEAEATPAREGPPTE